LLVVLASVCLPLSQPLWKAFEGSTQKASSLEAWAWSVPGQKRTDLPPRLSTTRHPSGRLVIIAVVLPLKPSFTAKPNTSSSASKRKALWSQSHLFPNPKLPFPKLSQEIFCTTASI
jgi:hypothetical protein